MDAGSRIRMRAGILRAAMATALAVAVPQVAAAQESWLRNDEAYHGKDAAQSGKFATLQIATTEPDQFIVDWQKPGDGVKLVSQDEVKRGRPIVMFIVVRGCRPDPQGACNVTVDFTTTDPSGKTYNDTKGAEVWVGRPPPPDLAIQLSSGGLGIAFEQGDPVGAYRVTARTTDHVAGITLLTEKVLTLLPD